jgi:hypothetical protein
MSCCIACFEYATRWERNPEGSSREDQAPQGHILCEVPDELEKKWFILGARPILVNNRWSIGPPPNKN